MTSSTLQAGLETFMLPYPQVRIQTLPRCELVDLVSVASRPCYVSWGLSTLDRLNSLISEAPLIFLIG